MHGRNVAHYLLYRLGIDEAHTQTTPAERDLLCECAATARTIVEIGAFEGVSTRAMRAAMPPDAHLIAVDPFPVSRWRGSIQLAIFRREVAQCTNGRVTLVRHFSYEAVTNWQEPIDLLFLDGDHGFDGVTRDFRQWTPHLRVGGTLLVHTSQPSANKPVPTSCGPYRLVREVIPLDPRFEIARSVDSTTVVVKRASA